MKEWEANIPLQPSPTRCNYHMAVEGYYAKEKTKRLDL